MAKKTFAVIGLGRFGQSVVEELVKYDYDVLIIDKDPDRLQKMSKLATHAMTLDTTDENALREVGINAVDHVVVAIGSSIQDSILTTMILKEMGVPKVTVKVQNSYHEKVVLKIGADEVVQPERLTGKRIAHRLMENNLLEYYDLSENHSFIVVSAVEKVWGSTVVNLDLRSKHNINLVAIKRAEDIIIPMPSTTFEKGDQLLLVGSNKDLHRFTVWSEK
jgi:trk system potassium uptake protein TrkA